MQSHACASMISLPGTQLIQNKEIYLRLSEICHCAMSQQNLKTGSLQYYATKSKMMFTEQNLTVGDASVSKFINLAFLVPNVQMSFQMAFLCR